MNVPALPAELLAAPAAGAIGAQILELLVLAVPVACVAWTVTHEEIFRETREYCARRSKQCAALMQRKFFYLFTCEYCFSHYISAIFLLITRFQLLYADWRGYLLSFFALVWVSNVYMNFYNRVRMDLTVDRKEIQVKEKQIQDLDEAGSPPPGESRQDANGDKDAL